MKAIISLTGEVEKGNQISTQIGFPTINIPIPKSIKKSEWGVYFSVIQIGDKLYPGATFLGAPATFHITDARCETYLLTLNKDLYGEKVKKKLLLKVRDVVEFKNVKLLKQQIRKDVKLARKYFGL